MEVSRVPADFIHKFIRGRAGPDSMQEVYKFVYNSAGTLDTVYNYSETIMLLKILQWLGFRLTIH